LQNQLTANLRESERAKQSALAALSWAEDWLLALQGTAPEPCSPPCTGFGIHAAGDLPPHPEFENLPWWQAQGFEAGIDPFTGNRLASFAADSANPPMWIIEVVHKTPVAANGAANNPANAKVWYRILVRGSGRTNTAISVIESTLTKTWSGAEKSPDQSTGSTRDGRISWRELR